MVIRGWRIALLAAVGASMALPAAASALPPFGGLTQLPGAAGCITPNGDQEGYTITGGCTDLRGAEINGFSSMRRATVSPDGKHVYTVARSGFLLAFERDPVSGALTEIAGTGGCKSNAAATGCEAVPNRLGGVNGVAVSPDGDHVYTTGRDSSAVAGWIRDENAGTLTPIDAAETGECVAEFGAGDCSDGRGLVSPSFVVVSPDGNRVYVAAGEEGKSSDAVAIFNRNPATGALTQPAGTAGCISHAGFDHERATAPLPVAGSCADASADGAPIDNPSTLAVSPDGNYLFVANGAYFDGPGEAVTNPLSGAPESADHDSIVVVDVSGPTPVAVDCLSDTGAGFSLCADGRSLVHAGSVVVSPDGQNVYAGARGGITGGQLDSIAVLDWDSGTEQLTQDPGEEGCVSWDGAAEGCKDVYDAASVFDLAMSSDGKHLYSARSNWLATWERDAQGHLDLLPLPHGCFSREPDPLFIGYPDCRNSVVDGTPRATKQGTGVVLSPDGLSAYVYAENINADDPNTPIDDPTIAGALTVWQRNLPPSCDPFDIGTVLHSGSGTANLVCSDPNGDPITHEIVDPPGKGTTDPVNEAADTVEYDATPGQSGADSFTYRATDGGAASAPAQIDVAIHTAPQTQIDSGPTGGATISNASPQFGFSATGAIGTLSFECSTDGGAFTADASTGGDRPACRRASHIRCSCRRRPTAARTSMRPRPRDLQVDTTAPDTTITVGARDGSKSPPTPPRSDSPAPLRISTTTSAASTAGRSLPAARPRPIPGSATARTRSAFAPSIRPATPTRRPPSAR